MENTQAPLLPPAAAAASRKLDGKVAVITGGASGIGKCTAGLFIQHGCKVIVADIQDELGAALCQELGSGALYVRCDVTDEDDVRKAVDLAVAKFGKLDIMYNNAGTSGEWFDGLVNSTKADFERVLAVNVIGPYLGMKHAARVMIPARRGCIINTASTVSVISVGSPLHAYCCSKRATAGMTADVAAELGQHGIRVNCVSPAWVFTSLATKVSGITEEAFDALNEARIPLKGVSLKTEDVANAALFLASDDAKFISGHNLVVDGGFTVVHPISSGLPKKEE